MTLDLNGFRLFGQPGSLHGIHVTPAQGGLVVTNGYVNEWGGDGLHVDPLPPGPISPPAGMRVDQVSWNDNFGSGIAGEAPGSLTVSQSEAHGNSGDGISWDVGDPAVQGPFDLRIQVIDSNLGLNGGNGLSADSGSLSGRVRVDRSVVSRNFGSGVSLTGVDLGVRQSEISHNAGHGVSSTDGDVDARDTTVSNNGLTGIQVVQTTGDSPALFGKGLELANNASRAIDAQDTGIGMLVESLIRQNGDGIFLGDRSSVANVNLDTGGFGIGTGISVGARSSVTGVRVSGCQTGVQTTVRAYLSRIFADGNDRGIEASNDSFLTLSFATDGVQGVQLGSGSRMTDSTVLGSATAVKLSSDSIVEHSAFLGNSHAVEIVGDDNVVKSNVFAGNSSSDVQDAGANNKVASLTCDLDTAPALANVGPPAAPQP